MKKIDIAVCLAYKDIFKSEMDNIENSDKDRETFKGFYNRLDKLYKKLNVKYENRTRVLHGKKEV